MHANVAQYAFDRVITQVAIAAMQLQAAVDHFESRVGCEAFCLCGEPGGGRLACSDRNRSAVQQQPGRIEFCRIVRDAELQRLEIGEPRHELSALVHVFDGPLKADLRSTDRSGTDVCPYTMHPRHYDLDTL